MAIFKPARVQPPLKRCAGVQSFQERLAEQRQERELNPESQAEFKAQRTGEESQQKRQAVRLSPLCL